ncbi:hypothetical protein VTN96DRAFT_8941 [Rasamsonia emersonii]
MREIKRDESLDSLSTRVQVRFMESMTEEDEVLVRSVHPALQARETVYVHEHDGRLVWVVPTSNAYDVLDTHAAGREILRSPLFEMQPRQTGAPIREDPFPQPINCRSVLAPEVVYRILAFFPGSVGMYVLVFGFMIIHFRDRKAMEECWGLGNVNEVGGLSVGYGILST